MLNKNYDTIKILNMYASRTLLYKLLMYTKFQLVPSYEISRSKEKQYNSDALIN